MNANFLNKYVRKLYTNINKKIYIITAIGVLVLLIWTAIQNLFGINKNNENNVAKNTSLYKPAETVIDGNNIKEDNYKEDEKLIEEFVNLCNDEKVEEAYNLLSDDCKDLVFEKNIEKFKNYYNEIFATKREVNIQSWISNDGYNTYRVRMIDDILSTGNYASSSNYQDYMTVVQNDGNRQLNIKGLICKKELHKTEEKEGLFIEVTAEIKYVNYLEYEFNVKNNTDKKVVMNTLSDISKGMYIEVTDNRKRSCISDDISIIELTIDGYLSKKFRLKYNQPASNNDAKTKKIYFTGIIKDYDLYSNNEEYNDILMITINL